MIPAPRSARRALRRGSIIVPVLIVLVLLAYLATEVSRELASDYGGSAYLRTTVEPGGLLDNAENHAERMLQADLRSGAKTDNYYENWGELGEDLARMSSDDGPQLSGDIVDMCGLFPVNSLLPEATPDTASLRKYEAVFLRLVQGLMDAYDVEGDPRALLESLRYWRGDPTAPRNDGNWYADQPGNYERPARAMLYPYELMLVRWEDVEDEGRRKVLLGSGGGPGLVDLVTTWGRGTINMNTAARHRPSSWPCGRSRARQRPSGRPWPSTVRASTTISTRTGTSRPPSPVGSQGGHFARGLPGRGERRLLRAPAGPHGGRGAQAAGRGRARRGRYG